MKSIWKFPLQITDHQEIDVPVGSLPLSVGFQHDILCLWMIVDLTKIHEHMTISIFGTGHPLPDFPGRFIGTAQQFGGALICHVFANSTRGPHDTP